MISSLFDLGGVILFNIPISFRIIIKLWSSPNLRAQQKTMVYECKLMGFFRSNISLSQWSAMKQAPDSSDKKIFFYC